MLNEAPQNHGFLGLLIEHLEGSHPFPGRHGWFFDGGAVFPVGDLYSGGSGDVR
jgi:hypothetical protein